MPLHKVPANAGIFGQGIKYPLEIDTKGRLALSSGPVLGAQALASILDTSPGERVMQPDYGAGDGLFEPLSAAVLEERLNDQVIDHESRIEIVSVDARDGGNGQHEYVIEYRNVGDATVKTLTYPYFEGP